MPDVGQEVREPSTAAGLHDSESTEFALPRVDRDPKLADKVQQILMRQIIDQKLPPGHMLPPERVLAASLGVSRSTVREAVRALVAKRVLESRTGSGVWVAAPDGGTLSDSMAIFLRGNRDIETTDLHEVRTTLEVDIAGKAAERATPDDIAKMTDECERLKATVDDPTTASTHDVQFHRLLATATRNPLYVVLLDAIGPALFDLRVSSLRIPGRADIALAAHRAILAAVERRDPDAAREAMQAHLDDSDRSWAPTPSD